MDKSKCIGIGLALGIVFGVAFHSCGLGIGIGIAIGLGIWFVQRRRGGGGEQTPLVPAILKLLTVALAGNEG